jgi:hypothetical protein
MYDHSIARQPSYFVDGLHFNEYVGTMIAHRLSGTVNPAIPDDFGIVLNRGNIESYVSTLK